MSKAIFGPEQNQDSIVSSETTKIPTNEKLAYGVGAIPENIFNAVLNQFGNSVYTIVFMLNPALVGIILAVPRLWDAVFDPIVGNFSDNLRSRWGRRKPLMLVGAMLACVTFIAIFWMPENLSDNLKFSYLLVGCIVFYSFSTLYCIPFIATGYEMTSDYNERSRLMGVRSFFAPVGIFLISWLFAFSQSEYFTDSVAGVRTVSIGLALILGVLSLVPIVKVKTKIPSIVSAKEKIPFFKALKLTVSNKSFLLALVPCLLVAMSLTLTGQLFVFVNIYHVYLGDVTKGAAMAAAFITTGQVLGMFSAPVFAKLATVYGKKNIMCVLLSMMAIGSASTFFLMTPSNPYLVVVCLAIVSPATTGIFMLYHSMIADVCDLDELNTGARREATYGAVAGWIYKSGSSLAVLMSGIGLWLAGFDADIVGNQTESTLLSLRTQYALIPFGATVIGLVLFTKYPITETVARETQARLQERKGVS